MRQHATILLTGFGPFPGVAENASALFVTKLTHLAARRFRGHRVVGRILPTEWEQAPARLAALYERERPKLALHFGVSERATGFAIETTAHNLCRPAADAAGRLPNAAVIAESGPRTLPSRLPGADIVARLGALGIPACLSHDAGGYLCNAVLYGALTLALEGRTEAEIGFIHIPATLERKSAGSQSRGLDWEAALNGGLEIIRACLGRPPPARALKQAR